VSTETCPLCNVPVKAENLRGHYARVHPKRLGTLTRTQTLLAPKPYSGRSRRKILLAVLVVVLLAGVAAYALRPGGQSQQEPTPSAAPLTVEASPSAVSIAGTGILSFNVTLTPQEPLNSSVVLSVPNRPPGVVKVIFQPATLSLSQNSGSSTVTLVVGQVFAPGTFPVRVVASVGSSIAETTVSLRIDNPTQPKHFDLMANSTGWNFTETSGPNPQVVVRRGETFDMTLKLLSAQDFHHYISIYPAGTQPSQVNEQSTLAYVRSDLAHDFPGSVTITFTSEIVGILEYYCDTHPVEMHGTITVTN